MTSTTASAWSPPQRRNQIAGAVLIVAVCAVWALVIPLINRSVEGTNPFEEGRPYDLGGATIVPGEGWQLPAGSGELLTTFSKGGASLILTGVVPAGSTIEASLQPAIDGLKADQATTWQVSPIEPFTTDGGASGGRVVGVSADNAAVTYVVNDGTNSITMLVSADAASWKSLESEIDAMVHSIVLVGVPAASTSVAP